MLWPLTIVFLSPFFLLILTKCTPQFWQPRSIFQWFVWLEAIMEMRMVDDSFSIWGQLEVNSEVTCSCNNNSTHVLDCVSQNVLQHFRVQRTRDVIIVSSSSEVELYFKFKCCLKILSSVSSSSFNIMLGSCPYVCCCWYCRCQSIRIQLLMGWAVASRESV